MNKIKRRKELKRQIEENKNELRQVSDIAMIDKFLNSEVNKDRVKDIQQSINKKYFIDENIEISNNEIDSLLMDLRGKFDETKFNALIDASKMAVIDSVIKPFGLAKIMFEDTDGGNVTTVHNAKKGIYSSNEDNYKRSDYDYNATRKTYKAEKLNSDDTYIDEYTGKILHKDQAELDHVFPLKKYHDNGGFMQSKEEKQAFARDQRNFVLTDQGLNKSKSDNNLKAFEATKSNGRDINNKEHFNLDNRRANPADHRSKEALKDHLPSSKKQIEYYAKSSVKTGGEEALKMGTQQALGLLLRELVVSIFDEIKDIFKNGFKGGKVDSTFFQVVKERFQRICHKVLSRWKDFLEALADGAISGFISNLVTTIGNMFITTGKRIVRIIREGFCSLLTALKMLISPPDGMSLKEAAHEATKLIAAGITVTVGILFEEIVDEFLVKWTSVIPVLSSISDALSTIITGTVTGLVTVFIVYMLDKIDLFGINSEARHDYVIRQLDEMISESLSEAENVFTVFETPKLVHLDGK